MVIEPNGNATQSAYAAGTNETKTATLTATSTDASSGAAQPMVSDKVTLSDAAQRLMDQSAMMASALENLPTPHVPVPSGKAGKKHVSELALLDVDAMRTIRDKLRAQSLKATEPGVQEKKLRDEQQQDNTISL